MPSSDWISFWDTKHSIFANDRHAAAHFRRIAEDICRHVPPGGAMLDYGCGEARSADRVAAVMRRLILCEPAPNVRAAVAARFAGVNNIAVLAPEDVAAIAPQSLDAVVMHSVAQYLGEEGLDRLIALFRRLLRPGGLFVLGDVIPLRVSALGDAMELLRFGVREGFFWAALCSLLRTYFSDYWRLRKSLGLSRYSEEQILAKLAAAGFLAKRARTNIGHNGRRMTFLAYAREGRGDRNAR